MSIHNEHLSIAEFSHRDAAMPGSIILPPNIVHPDLILFLFREFWLCRDLLSYHLIQCQERDA